MANNQSSVKFDHREIAVIFSLFIFVSLLMFTVGILVGKGLAQARYEGGGHAVKTAEHAEHGEGEAHEAVAQSRSGTSITTGHEEEHEPDVHAKSEGGHEALSAHSEHESEHAAVGHEATSSLVDDGEEHKPLASHDDHESAFEPKTDLELVPKHAKNKHDGVKDFAKTHESESLLKNPKMAGLFEGAGGGGEGHSERAVASVPSKISKSLPKGKFTVQIGAYPNQREAVERMEALKKLGFPYAYFSAINPSDKNTLYRVWLGYFSDEASAKSNGETLQARGEVNSYIVRETKNIH